MTVAYCTVVSHRRIAYARVIAEGLARAMPGASLFVAITDPQADYSDEPFEVVPVDAWPQPQVRQMAFRYAVATP